MNKKVRFEDLGLIDYKKCWDYQEELFSKILAVKSANRKEDKSETLQFYSIPNGSIVHAFYPSRNIHRAEIPSKNRSASHIMFQLNPSEKSFRLFLAKSLHHMNEKTSYLESIKILWSYIKDDDFPYEAWHYLGLNYGKLKKHDFSSYALAEKYLLVNQIKNAKIHIQRVKRFTKDPVLKNKIKDLEKEILKRKSE